jgi:N-acetylneuraminic acid mutarotase
MRRHDKVSIVTPVLLHFLILICLFGFAKSVMAKTTNGTTPPPARFGHGMVSLDGKLYVFGGATIHHGVSKTAQVNRYNDLWCYNPLTRKWEEIQSNNDPPSARDGFTTVTIDGKIYYLFGEDSDGMKNDIIQYDPETREWSTITIETGSSPDPRKYASAAAHNGNIYVSGGQDASGGNRMDAWRYNFVENTWNPWVNHAPCAGHSMILYFNYLLAFGGIRWSDEDYRDDFRYCDPNGGSEFSYIYTTGNAPSGRAFHAAASDGQKSWIFGGKNSSGHLLDAYAIQGANPGNPTSSLSLTGIKAWPGAGLMLLDAAFAELWTPKMKGLEKSGVAESSGCIYLFGGLDPDSNAVDAFYRYDIDADSWEDLTAVQDHTNPNFPSEFDLSAYPNPFNASTTILYTLPISAVVELTVYNLSGQVVRSFKSTFQHAGNQDVTWDGSDQQGSALPSGIYVCHIKTAGYTQSLKLTLLR